MIGKKLGPYEITGKLGEGGMGEVYRATDANLKREVAIKVLPGAFTQDPARLDRFAREAQILAQLHHPHIASIFGLETEGGVRGLVMELVEGPTLGERLERGPLPVEEALPIARQIAEALELAHDKGIIHRDLKPQNVKLTPKGQVKVLDFGLAKAMDPAGSDSSASPLASPTMMNSPTLTAAMGTQLGVILGTAAYMAPEQARGQAVDKRADIWAFGVVLYEMLTGAKLFAAETVSDTLAGVLKTVIDLDLLPAETPGAIRRLLRRCLERNPKKRLHDVADARIVIDEVLAGEIEEATATAPPGDRQPTLTRLLAAAGVALALGGAAGWLLHRPPAASPATGSRWALAIPDGLSLSTAEFPQLALSRDGTLQAAVVLDANGDSHLLLRSSNEFEARLMPETARAVSPFFSPDGRWLGFFRDAALMKVPVSGGPAVRLAEAAIGSRGASWGNDGFIYFTPDATGPIRRVSENGGQVEAVTQLDETRNERTHRWPEVLPGDDVVIFTDDTQSSTEYYDDARIEAVRLSTGERRVLVEGSSQARYAPSGHLVFARGGSLFGVPFDARSLAVSGSPFEIAQGVSTDVGSGGVQFALSQSGAAIWTPGTVMAGYRIVWMDSDGTETATAVPPAPYNELALSPDGGRAALVGGQGGISDLWVSDLVRGTLTRLTFGEFATSPTWTPDGSQIAYGTFSRASGEGTWKILLKRADGSRDAVELISDSAILYPSSFTPDGRTLLLDRYQPGSAPGEAGDIWSLSLDGEREPQPVVEGSFLETEASVSPDGKWLAYVSNEGGRNSVFVRPYPAGEGRWQISFPQGVEPRWSRDGREMFYRAAIDLYRVPIDTSAGFSAGRPTLVFEGAASGTSVHSYSPSADGARFFTFRQSESVGSQRTLYVDLAFAPRLSELESRR
jgi:eukaryotic-like serine/threonine-protein kinase